MKQERRPGELTRYEMDYARAVVAAELVREPGREIRSLLHDLFSLPKGSRSGLLDLANMVSGAKELNPIDKHMLSKSAREQALLAQPIAGELLAFFVDSLCRLSASCGSVPTKSKDHPEGLSAAEYGREIASAFKGSGELGGQALAPRQQTKLQKLFCNSLIRLLGGAKHANSCSSKQFEDARRKALDEVYKFRNGAPAPAGTDHHAKVIKKLGVVYQIMLEDYKPQS